MASHFLCFKVHDVNRAALCAGRKTQACEKFSDFLLVLPSFTIETDHRPLLALLKTKGLDDKSKMAPDICPFSTVRDDLTMQEGLLLYHTRLVISVELRKDILSKIHNGH